MTDIIQQVDTPNLNDHDILLVLYRDVQHLTQSLKDLKEGDIKELKEGTASRLAKLEETSVTKGDLVVLQKEGDKIHDDHERRIRFLERWVWIGIALVAALEFGIQVWSNLHP